MNPAFVIAADCQPDSAGWLDDVSAQCAAILGFTPRIVLRPLSDLGGPPDADELFVLPASFDFSVWEKETLGRVLAEWRRSGPDIEVHADTPDPGHPLVVECFADVIARALAGSGIPPQRLGLLLVASGHGDGANRAQSYRLMRLLWEQLGVKQADVAFVRNVQTFLGQALERCLRDPLDWLLLPQMQWPGEHLAYARVILENFQRAHPGAAGWRLLDAPGAHPALTAWFTQRIVQLWRDKRSRQSARIPSPRRQQPRELPAFFAGDAAVAEVFSADALRGLLTRIVPPSGKYFIKVTWHGYAPGTYTDPAALDLLLEALPGKAVILEGHTSSRNLGGVAWDWETEAQCHRAWIRQQEAEYLDRTGLAEVMRRHGAQYVNVTEAFWDGRCAPAGEILDLVDLECPELAAFVPAVLWENRGAPFISFAKFKGPTRLGISNLFGLIPAPLRSAWHGPNITYFARVCCGLARLYGALFPMFGLVEGLYTAVRWDRQGLYRSRWGNYDILANRGILTLSRGLPAADILASRLQGQDVMRSAFFDVVRDALGWSADAAECALPQPMLMRFV
ncbi:MAG TPA: hypothetical protein VMI94_02235 [Bryobacteraceae bacterium]|nr:hypothetical protein [Bryobacteraceae bacterium]